MIDKTSDKLITCPCCGGEAALKKYYESSDGKCDKRAQIICCDCELKMELTWDEFSKAQEEFGYTGGYYSQNKSFWDGMHQKLINKWNTRKPMERILERLKTLKQIELDREDACDEDGFGEGEEIFSDGVSQGRHEAFYEAIEIVKEEGGIRNE